MAPKPTLLSIAIFGIPLAAVLRLAHGPGAEPIPRILTLAMLGVVPLALLALPSVGAVWDRMLRVAAVFLPVGAALGIVGLWRPTGEGGLWAAGWMAFALFAASMGALRLSRALRPFDAPRAVSAIGLLYLPVGAAWFVASRAGLRPMGFDPIIVLLTAVHFHFAALAAPVIASRVIDSLEGTPRRVAAIAGFAIVAAVPIVAAGFTVSPLLALVGAALLAFALIAIAGLCLNSVQRTMKSRWARVLLVVSGVSLLLSMPLAVAYQWGQVSGTELIDLAWMLRLHGYANAHGFATCGLLTWAIEDRRRD